MATITSATSGLASATSTWVGGVVPGTTFAGTRTTTAAGFAIGATTIALAAGASAVVAGEHVKFAGDPHYYKVATGLGTGAGNIVLDAPGLLQAVPASATTVSTGLVYDKVIIATGHTVTYDLPDSVWGDDTATGVPINGTGHLKASRTTSSRLGLRGDLVVDTGRFNWGTEADPIPWPVVAGLRYNDSATMADGKWGIRNNSASGVIFAGMSAWGATKSVRAKLAADAAQSAAAIVVQSGTASGWQVGDRIYYFPTTGLRTTYGTFTVTSVAGDNIGTSALPAALPAGHKLINVTRNVYWEPMRSTVYGFVEFSSASSANAAQQNTVEVGYVEVCGAGTNSDASRSGALTLGQRGSNVDVIRALTGISNHERSRAGLLLNIGSIGIRFQGVRQLNNPPILADLVIANNNKQAYALSNGSCLVVNDLWIASIGSTGGAAFAKNCIFNRPNIAGAVQGLYQSGSAGNVMYDCDVDSSDSFVNSAANGVLKVFRGSIGTKGIGAVWSPETTGVGAVEFDGTSFGAGSVIRAAAANNCYDEGSYCFVKNKNGSAVEHEYHTKGGSFFRDNTLTRRGTSSFKATPLNSTFPTRYSFKVAAPSGVTRLLLSLRKDSAYSGAAPYVTVSDGNLVAPQTVTLSAAADTWEQFTVDLINPGAASEYTVAFVTNGAAGNAWLDGIPFAPFVTNVRHYGYVLDESNARRVANDKLAVTNEATVLAYPVTVDHGTSTITVTGNATATQIGDCLEADLCQTANQAQAVHYTLGVGGAFTTSYEVLIGSGAAITGAYTDALGLHVAVEATLPTTGCQIQLYDVTADAELDNREVAGTAYSYPITYDTYTAGHTLRLRVAQAGASAAKLPQEVFAALTTGGAVFTVPDEDDTVYASNGIDGSTCDVSGGGEFTADYPNLQIDVSDVDGMTSVQRVYAWSAWANTTTQGIRLMFGAVEALDTLNYVIHQDVVDAKFDNVNGAPVLIAGGYIRRADGTTVIAATSNSIQMDPGRAYVAPSIESDVAAIKAKTDNLPADPADASDIAASFSAAAATAAAIKAKTDNLPAAPAAVGDIPTAAQNADKLLGRTLAGAADGGRTVKDALRASRNKSQLVGSTLTVYQEDDATPAWTADVTTASRDPVSGIDPA